MLPMLLWAVSASAQQPVESLPDSLLLRARQVENTKMLGLGPQNTLDTYITREEFSGVALRFFSQTVRMRLGRAMKRRITHQGSLSFGKDRADDNSLLGGMYDFSYALLWDKKLLSCLTLQFGGEANAAIGFLYNTQGGNNSGQLKASLDVAPAASLLWDFRLMKRRTNLRYSVSAPLVGLRFSPNYGQSYYEIFSKDNYDRNVRLTTPFSAPCLRQSLILGVRFKRSEMNLGYVFDVRQYEVNHLKYHDYSHIFMIGYTVRGVFL